MQFTEQIGVGTEQVIIFYGSHQGAINHWLAATKGKVEITRALQSQSGVGPPLITITIFYVKTAM